jgi:hypothetical protein
MGNELGIYLYTMCHVLCDTDYSTDHEIISSNLYVNMKTNPVHNVMLKHLEKFYLPSSNQI